MHCFLFVRVCVCARVCMFFVCVPVRTSIVQHHEESEMVMVMMLIVLLMKKKMT